MKLQLMTGNTCLVHSAAMVMDVEPEDIFRYLQHDGTHMVGDGFRHPHGIHAQEIVNFGLTVGVGLITIEMWPQMQWHRSAAPAWEIWTDETATRRWFQILNGNKGILLGSTERSGHAVAWDGYWIYDPARGIRPVDTMNPSTFLMAVPSPIIKVERCVLSVGPAH